MNKIRTSPIQWLNLKAVTISSSRNSKTIVIRNWTRRLISLKSLFFPRIFEEFARCRCNQMPILSNQTNSRVYHHTKISSEKALHFTKKLKYPLTLFLKILKMNPFHIWIFRESHCVPSHHLSSSRAQDSCFMHCSRSVKQRVEICISFPSDVSKAVPGIRLSISGWNNPATLHV